MPPCHTPFSRLRAHAAAEADTMPRCFTPPCCHAAMMMPPICHSRALFSFRHFAVSRRLPLRSCLLPLLRHDYFLRSRRYDAAAAVTLHLPPMPAFYATSLYLRAMILMAPPLRCCFSPRRVSCFYAAEALMALRAFIDMIRMLLLRYAYAAMMLLLRCRR